jgi:ATP-dependent RNA helicase RhlE
MTTFEDLNISKPLLNALGDLGFIHPTPVQEQVFSVAMSGQDVVGVAQTGTGKTLAYMLPLLRQLPYSDKHHPRILVIVPTRELVVQVVGEIEKLTTYMSVRIAGVYGGVNINTQKDIIFNGLDILVATPGRLLDLNLNGVLRFKMIQKLVIDEMDEMLSLGFLPQLVRVMDLLPEKRQNLLFSATLTDDIEEIIKKFFNNPKTVEIAASGTPLDKISQTVYKVPNFYTKITLLEYVLMKNPDMSKVIVFGGTKKKADMIFELLDESFPGQMGVMHSNKSQNNRLQALNDFETGKTRILIGSDLLARGLDIKDVTHVINFELPELPEDYIHRIGRTGRADKEGAAISFATEAEQPGLRAIEKLMSKRLEVIPLPENLIISKRLLEEEVPKKADKDYMKSVRTSAVPAAFHSKSEKNSKVNLGGSYKRTIKDKYKKPIKKPKRGGK